MEEEEREQRSRLSPSNGRIFRTLSRDLQAKCLFWEAGWLFDEEDYDEGGRFSSCDIIFRLESQHTRLTPPSGGVASLSRRGFPVPGSRVWLGNETKGGIKPKRRGTFDADHNYSDGSGRLP